MKAASQWKEEQVHILRNERVREREQITNIPARQDAPRTLHKPSAAIVRDEEARIRWERKGLRIRGVEAERRKGLHDRSLPAPEARTGLP